MLHTDIIEFSKKRKLLDKQSGLPISKYKFRDRNSALEHLSAYAEDQEVEKVFNARMKELINGESRLHSFAKGSASSDGETACAMHPEANSRPFQLKVFTYDRPIDSEPKTPNQYVCDKPSTSSSSCGSNSPKNTYNNICIETIREEEAPCTEEQQRPGFDDHDDYICSNFKSNEIEECMDDELKETSYPNEMVDDESDDTMLYSNGVTSDLFLLSSGRWKTNTDAPQGARKPTIDQEFEQYFSMLML